MFKNKKLAIPIYLKYKVQFISKYNVNFNIYVKLKG